MIDDNHQIQYGLIRLTRRCAFFLAWAISGRSNIWHNSREQSTALVSLALDVRSSSVICTCRSNIWQEQYLAGAISGNSNIWQEQYLTQQQCRIGSKTVTFVKEYQKCTERPISIQKHKEIPYVLRPVGRCENGRICSKTPEIFRTIKTYPEI